MYHQANLTAENRAEMFQGSAAEYLFCQQCEAYETCNRSYGKIHPVSSYVYRYLSEIEKGFLHYPNPGSWENQPDWFILLLNSAQSELESLRRADKDK